jgi:hypothetical protein
LYRKDENRGELFENSLELHLVTRKLRWGTWYTNYALTVSQERQKYQHKFEDDFGEESLEERETKIFSTTHSFRTGLRGRGPGKRLTRAQWNVEGELFYSRARIERTVPFEDEEGVIEERTEEFMREISRYSATGDLTYPFGWATFFFSTGIALGESNSRNFTRYYYEERLDYPVMRNLRLSFRWKELWENFEDGLDHKVREYDLFTEYRLGKIIFNLEARILRATTEGRERYVRTIFLKLRRFI